MTATLDHEVAELRRVTAELQQRLDEARAERDEGAAQKAAMTEILEVINASPGNLAPVFDAMLERATRLCDATHGQLWTYDGERFHPVTMRGDPGFTKWVLARGPLAPSPRAPHGRIAQGERLVHIADVLKDEAYGSQHFREYCEVSETRTQLVVPLRKNDVLLGVIHVYRREVRPFSDKQIALLQNFAEQAVIAMENARLLTETREALEQQTATADVLGVINSSPGDLTPVFDAILDKAHTLCRAAFGSLGIFEGDTWRAIVQRGYGEPLASTLRQGGRGSDIALLQELIDGAPFVHVADLALLDLPIARANVAAGIRACWLWRCAKTMRRSAQFP